MNLVMLLLLPGEAAFFFLFFFIQMMLFYITYLVMNGIYIQRGSDEGSLNL